MVVTTAITSSTSCWREASAVHFGRPAVLISGCHNTQVRLTASGRAIKAAGAALQSRQKHRTGTGTDRYLRTTGTVVV